MSEGACLLAMQQKGLTVQVVLQGERGSVAQAEVWVLCQLCAQQTSKFKYHINLGPGLNGARSFGTHIVDGLTRTDAQGVD